MKKYTTPTMTCVELRSEERFAACEDGACNFNDPGYTGPTTACNGIYIDFGS